MASEHHPLNDGKPAGGTFWKALRVVAGDLPPGDTTPFAHPTVLTAGVIDKRVILQDQLWVDRQARPHRLIDMTVEHRKQVLDLLTRVAPDWLADAVAWEFIGAIHGRISPPEAAERLMTLDALTSGWTHHTPLGQRLHQLNRTRPQPLPPPTLRVTANQADQPDTLTDTDRGQWTITTASGTRYDVDLDVRRIRRRPPPASPSGSDKRDGSPASRLEHDHEWLPLDTLVWCRTGHPLLALDRRPGTEGRGGYVASTLVREIALIQPPAGT